ncbi:elongation factor Ts, mitochondrial [Galendromus occidentalis]|uniref:Elongation factor Ts, mitochondrial n=1 Tax=Galendromus occidentalis TaxID=34638 RepID=A0AAJ7L661_9ACAR|nr:elongation factor Ts, mitochondrial [Galendromus occidentalis]
MVFLSRLLRADICKQSLLSLRKSTGHSFQHCKKALEHSNNDINEAVKWLESEAVKQGWTKLERAAARATKEGVFGVARIENVAAVTEVNCETDFVARNSELRGFAARVSEGLCGEFAEKAPIGLKQISWEEISQLILGEQSIEESRARLVAKLGENLNVRRSLVVSPPDGEKVAVSCHPDGTFGRYGAAIFYKGGNAEIAEKLCRHIIGMRPIAIGTEEDLARAKKARDAYKGQAKEAASDKQDAAASGTEGPGGEGEEEAEEEAPESVDEDLLLLQNYVFDQDLKVADILREHDMEIMKFWRFECGDELMESKARE